MRQLAATVHLDKKQKFVAMKRRKNGEIWGGNPVMEPSITHLDPWANLSCAILKHAAKQAQSGDLGAAEWLANDELAGWFCDLLLLDSLAMQRVARQWLKKPSGKVIVKCIEEVDLC